MAQEQAAQINTSDADLDVFEAVQASINSLNIIRESHLPITIQVRQGVVSLSGLVTSDLMRRAVLYRAATTRGVVKVIDNLYDDTHLRMAVAAALRSDPLAGPHQPEIVVTSYMGVITLSGLALPADVQNKALELAAAVPGVRKVVSNLAA